MYGIIYKAINIIDGKRYIGQTIKTLEQRKKAHLSAAKKDNPELFFHKAIKKYGENTFIWEEIDCAEYDQNELNFLERYWIHFYYSTNSNYGYNLAEGGHGGATHHGPIHSEEQKKKWSIERSGEGNHRFGKPCSPKVLKILEEDHQCKRLEVRKKLSFAAKRNMAERVANYTKEDREKLGDSARGRIWIRFLKNDGEYDSNYIMKEDFDNWKSLGWERGRIPSVGKAVSKSNKTRVNQATNTKWMHKVIGSIIQRKRIPIENVENFLNDSWVLGYK